MRSLSICSLNKKRGFTLIEVIIAISIMALAMALGLFLGVDALKASYSRSERDTLVFILSTARSRSMANIDESPWGVCVSGSSYVLFRGSACDAAAASSELTPLGAGAAVSGLGSPLVFSQLSGTTTGASMAVAQQGRTSNISVNYEGTIVW